MDDRRTGDAAVTGVAKGALGTGTALEETQEWVIPAELQASPKPAGVAADLQASPKPAGVAADPAAAERAAGPAAQARVAAHGPAIEPARVEAVEAVDSRPIVAVPPRRRTASSAQGSLGSPRTAGIAAAVLLALIGITAVVTSARDGDFGAAPVAPAEVTAEPTDAPPAEEDGNGGDNGGGKRDKDNGRGNGNGNGRGNGGGRGNN